MALLLWATVVCGATEGSGGGLCATKGLFPLKFILLWDVVHGLGSCFSKSGMIWVSRSSINETEF